MRCTLEWTCKTLNVTGQCCSLCCLRRECKDACRNAPDNCIMFGESTPLEMLFENGITLIRNSAEFEQIAKAGKPQGLFYAKVGGKFKVMDNRTGVSIMQTGFKTSDEAIAWLTDRANADMREE